MDRSAAPWRVLDEGTGEPLQSPGTGAATSGASALPTRLPRPSWTAIGGFGLAAALAIGAFVVAASSPQGEIVVDGGAPWIASGSAPMSRGSSSAGTRLVVDVQGAVLRPGVLELDAGARVGDAIAAAGGYGPRVDAERAARELNLAKAVSDGDRIVVPSRDDPPGSAPSGQPGPGSGSGGDSGGSSGDLVDLNSATAAELDKLPGVGPVTAQKIIDARAEKPFATVDDLRDRKIVGSSVFEKLRDLVTVR
jgi:competence protein ComEA